MTRFISSFLALAALFLSLAGPSLRADGGVCASVVIQINQQFALERTGFQATLTVSNGQPASLDNFTVTLNFADANGNPVAFATDAAPNANGLFYYRVQTGYTAPGSIPGGSSQTIAYFIVPALGAAGTSASGSLYYVGATIQYSINGAPQTVQVTPAPITVQPMPLLQLQYFLPGNVYGVDPFNPVPPAPSVPFPVGVRVINTSPYATAQQVQIQSGQPQIIDNKLGLLVNFQILGCQVNGGGALPSLLVNFGNIGPGQAAMADWLMICSLSGTFENFTAEVSHDPELGGNLTSLIPESAISTHRLLGVVLVDLPGRDAIPDFLATDDGWSDNYNSVQVYESDNDQFNEPVDYFAPGNTSVSLSSAGSNSVLSVSTTSVMMYVRTSSPIAADQSVSAVRSDGKKLPAANCWVSKNKDNSNNWVYWLNLFDTSTQPGLTYALTFSNPVDLTAPPVLTILGGQNFQVLPGQPLTIKVAATDPNNLIPVLSTGTLPDGAVFTDNKNGTGSLAWTPVATQLGTYSVQFKATVGSASATQSGTIQVVSQLTTGFSGWQNKYWPGVTDPNIIGPNANPSGDGLDNLLKYALGGDPTVPDDSILPVVGMDLVAGQHFLTLTYRQLQGDPTLLYEVVASNDLSVSLASWTVQTQTETTDQSAAPPGFILVKVIDSVPVETGSVHRFLKLRVTQTGN
jgi:hypothetical protein